MTDRPIRQALLSVSDKTGIVEFAQGLVQRGVKLLSTGGTAKLLEQDLIRHKQMVLGSAEPLTVKGLPLLNQLSKQVNSL